MPYQIILIPFYKEDDRFRKIIIIPKLKIRYSKIIQQSNLGELFILRILRYILSTLNLLIIVPNKVVLYMVISKQVSKFNWLN